MLLYKTHSFQGKWYIKETSHIFRGTSYPIIGNSHIMVADD